MRAGFLAVAAAASGVLALPQAVTTTESSSPEVTNIDEIYNLAQSAYDQAQELASDSESTKRGSTCSWSNIRIRREW